MSSHKRIRTYKEQRNASMWARRWFNGRPENLARARCIGLRITTSVRREEETGAEYTVHWFHCPACNAGWDTLVGATSCCGRTA